jgi:hypothetical protein
MRPLGLRLVLGALAAGLASGSAAAQTSSLRELCVDRPGKDTPPCIVDKGHAVVELGALRYSQDEQEGTDEYDLGEFLIRYGVSDTVEAQLGFTPYSIVRSRNAVTGRHMTVSGVGDLTGALKVNFLSPDGSGVSAAAQAFVTAPVGKDGIGAGVWEGGLIIPVSFELSDKWGLTLDPEIHVLGDENGGGHHLAYAGVISVSRELGGGFEGSAEIWSMVDRDPASHRTQASFDLSMAWTPEQRPNLQLDAELDFGLTRATAAVEATAGVAYRF